MREVFGRERKKKKKGTGRLGAQDQRLGAACSADDSVSGERAPRRPDRGAQAPAGRK